MYHFYRAAVGAMAVLHAYGLVPFINSTNGADALPTRIILWPLFESSQYGISQAQSQHLDTVYLVNLTQGAVHTAILPPSLHISTTYHHNMSTIDDVRWHVM